MKNKKERYKKIVQWEGDTGWVDVWLLILFSPLFIPIFYIVKIIEYVKENRVVYWEKIKEDK